MIVGALLIGKHAFFSFHVVVGPQMGNGELGCVLGKLANSISQIVSIQFKVWKRYISDLWTGYEIICKMYYAARQWSNTVNEDHNNDPDAMIFYDGHCGNSSKSFIFVDEYERMGRWSHGHVKHWAGLRGCLFYEIKRLLVRIGGVPILAIENRVYRHLQWSGIAEIDRICSKCSLFIYKWFLNNLLFASNPPSIFFADNVKLDWQHHEKSRNASHLSGAPSLFITRHRDSRSMWDFKMQPIGSISFIQSWKSLRRPQLTQARCYPSAILGTQSCRTVA